MAFGGRAAYHKATQFNVVSTLRNATGTPMNVKQQLSIRHAFKPTFLNSVLPAEEGERMMTCSFAPDASSSLNRDRAPRAVPVEGVNR